MSIDVWRKPEDIPSGLVGTAVTIGVFDGVHKGHRAVLRETVRQAKERGLVSVALTFDPHPASVHSTQNVHLVSTLGDRIDRLAAAGIDAVYVQRYTLDYARATPREFFEKQLVGELRARVVVVGEDVRFGRRNEGDGAVLAELGKEKGVEVTLVSDLAAPEGRRWSSTWVRELLAAGDVAGAARVLGRRHRIRGEVVHGFQRGRAIGFPTANLDMDEVCQLLPQIGVYATRVRIEGECELHPAMTSVGTRPTFDGTRLSVETYILDFDADLYGRKLEVAFLKRIRGEKKFADLQQLRTQMADDERCIRELNHL